MRKAQITMESLLLYGAAFLVVLLAIAALTYFGVLDLGRYLPEKCNFESSGVFTCNNAKVVDSTTDTVQVEIINSASKSISIVEASFEADDGALVSGCGPDTVGTDIIPGGSIVVQVDCTTENLEVGTRVAGKFRIKYKFTDSALESTVYGDIRKSAETP